MGDLISRTLPEAGMDKIFTEVKHHESLGLKNPEQLRLFHLNVSNNQFVLTGLEDFIENIVGEYVFSRAQMERLTDPKAGINPHSIGIKALRVMKKNGAADQKGTGNELGEIMLYAFLEGVLKAPKIFSKVELNAVVTPFGRESDSVHLLSLGNIAGVECYQTVFGTSEIEGDIRDAIDRVFNDIERIEKENGKGIQLVANQAFEESFDEKMAAQVKAAIVPEPGAPAVSDKAYGIFLGYSLGLDPHTRSTIDFLRDLDRKMEADIKSQAGYIASKIKSKGLDTHSFYFYLVPFNDAAADKKSVMEYLLG